MPIDSHQVDDRDRRDRTERNTANWDIQADHLLHAYLYFQSIQGPDGLNSDSVGSSEEPTAMEAPSIEVVDFFCESPCASGILNLTKSI